MKGDTPQGLPGNSGIYCTKTFSSAACRSQVLCGADCANLHFPWCTCYPDESQAGPTVGQDRPATHQFSFILTDKHLYDDGRAQPVCWLEPLEHPVADLYGLSSQVCPWRLGLNF